ncbi:MAG TPA: PadR family transcriptional regulator [Gaiellales bacterium]|jgi:DNA-binding PadR family transcriptional regulator|nr:PadR family transcriptional regulator [Gaiellales bacterium]
MTYAETIPVGGHGRRRRHAMHRFARRHGGGDPFAGFGRGGWGRGNAFFGGGGRRAGRGDIRAAILALLAEESMYGYQIIRELGERTGGAWNPSPGSVYPTLQQLEDEELVREQQSDTGRRVYELTDAGREAAAAQPSPAPWEQAAAAAHDEHGDLRSLVFQVLGAVRQVGMAGTPAQREKAQEVLRGTRRSLYQILAEEDAPGDEPGGTVV